MPSSRRRPGGELAVMDFWIGRGELDRFAAERTDAHRIATVRSGWIERFGPDVILSFSAPGDVLPVLGDFDVWCGATGFGAERVFARRLVRQPSERDVPEVLRGGSEPPRRLVSESGLRFEVDFSAGYSAGLFCDQRGNRGFLRGLRPRRLLNCFAYTCAFSVAAAASGAETLNIDLSRRALDRGRRNFELNGLDPRRHRFIADDVFAVMPRLARRGERFDAIVLDPPTFSRGSKRRAFRVEDDFDTLVALALDVAAPDAHVLLSSNSSRLRSRELATLAARCASTAQLRRAPQQPDFPPGHGAAAIWLALRGPPRPPAC